jgi:hypothetical protein
MLLLLLGLVACALWSETSFAQNASVQLVMDPTFRMPAPPHQTFLNNPENSNLWGTVMFVIGLIAVAFSIRDAKRTSSLVPVMVALAGLFCTFPEVFVNVLGGCFWSEQDGHIAFMHLGRKMSWYIFGMWFGFAGVLCYICYSAISREVSTKWLWIAFACAGVGNIIIEEVLLNVPGIYTYYGHQPLVLLTRFPWWWLAVNVSGLFLGAALAHRYRAVFTGWKSLFVLILIPTAYIGCFTFAVMPTSVVIYGDYPWLVTQLGGLATCALALAATMGTMSLVLGRNPLDMNGRGKPSA